ncbi:MAG: hypothetical protein GY940_24095 [bacterium]|nr:hypothetical protein [bacterium]
MAIILISAISLMGSRITFFNRRFALGFRNILFTGTEYIIVGALLGGMGLDLLDEEALTKLEPFLVFGLCWVGFLFGLQFDIRQLKNLMGHRYFSISAVQSLVTFLFVAASMYFLFEWFTNYPMAVRLLIAITLGSSASCTANSALAIVSKNYKFKNRRLLDLMLYISSLDGFYALIFLGAALSIFPGAMMTPAGFMESLKWLILPGIMGIIPALILISLSRTRFSPQEFFVYIIGTVILCGGLAHQIHYSPLISGMICGLVTANFSRHNVRAMHVVLQAEKSLYIMLLLLLGAGWKFYFQFNFVLLITAVYLVMRLLGKVAGAFIGVKTFKPDYDVPSSVGLGLISDGGLSVAIIINFQLLYPGIAAPLVTVIIISVLVNELLGPLFILGRFDKNERQPVIRQKKEND